MANPAHLSRVRSRPVPLRRSIGARIVELRGERGWEPRELAARLGISLARLLRYESGAVPPPLGVLLRLSRLLSVSVDYLLTGDAAGAPPLREPQLLERFRKVGALGEAERAVVIALLDAWLAFHTLRRLRRPPPGGKGEPGPGQGGKNPLY